MTELPDPSHGFSPFRVRSCHPIREGGYKQSARDLSCRPPIGEAAAKDLGSSQPLIQVHRAINFHKERKTLRTPKPYWAVVYMSGRVFAQMELHAAEPSSKMFIVGHGMPIAYAQACMIPK